MSSTNILAALALSLSVPLSALTGCTANVGEPGEPATGTVQLEGRPAGAVCAFDAQCATRRCDADTEAGTCGKCMAIVALGQDCTGPNQGCSSTAVCKDGVCQSLRKVAGEACSRGGKGGDNFECDAELHCAQVGTFDQIGMCLPRIPLGKSCANVHWSCVLGAECNAYEVCAVPVPGACVITYLAGIYGLDLDKKLPYGYECGDPGTLAENAACALDGSLGDNGCGPGLACDGTTCVPLPGKGETCVHYACGEGLFCNQSPGADAQSYCDTPREEGDACDDSPCAAGLECRANTCRVACQ